MRFLDQKEEVIDIQMTPTGTRLLQLGGFKPSYYCFFDDDVIYDSNWGGVSGESQNDIETRIQDMPRLQAQRAKYSVETEINNDVGTNMSIMEYDVFQAWEYLSFMGVSQIFADSGYFSDMLGLGPGSSGYSNLKQNKTNRLYSFYGSLGNMDYQSGDLLPTWSIKFLKAPLSGSSAISGSMGEKAYVLHSDLQYKLSVESAPQPMQIEDNFDNEEDPLHSIPLERVGTSLEDVNASPISLDGTYIEVIDDYLFLSVEEANTQYFKENFEIEVYRIENNSSVSDGSNEKRLFFDNEDIGLEDVMSHRNPQLDPYGEKEADWKGTVDPASTEAYNRRYVGYYFDILTDEQIPSEIFCKALTEDKTTFNFLDTQMFTCVDMSAKSDLDPYNLPDDIVEECD